MTHAVKKQIDPKIEALSPRNSESIRLGTALKKAIEGSNHADTYTATITILFRDGKELTFFHHPEYENKPNFSNSVQIEDGFLVITDQVDNITMYPSDVLLEVKILHDL